MRIAVPSTPIGPPAADMPEQARESKARYLGLLEAAPDAMVVVDHDGAIVLLNTQAEKQFGYPRGELIGQPVINLIPEGFAERLIADGLRSPEAALAQQIGTGIELLGRRNDGSEFPIELMLSPFESPQGVLVTAAIRDISVRKAAEEQLRRTEAQYRGLLEAAPDALVVVNPLGEIVLVNLQAEKRFGYSRDELIGQKVTNIIPEGFAERLIADGLRSPEAALAQQIGTGIELSALRKDGSAFPIEIMLSPLDSPDGVLVTAAIRDISVRRESMDRLHASEQTAIEAADAMSAFLATMSHEIRTPLNGVLGMAQAMARGDLPPIQRERLGIIQTAGQSLLALLNDLLDLSKIQAGKIELEDGVIDARDLADGALAFKALVEDKDVHFHLSLEPSAEGCWRADPKRVRQILHNLVSNAVKFTDRGSVTVQIAHDGDRLTMRVIDTGIGIAATRLAQIYERFVQADASMTRRYGGSGLGLAICRDLVALMGGTITVDSAPNVGTTFTVALPLVRAEGVKPAETDTEPSARLSSATGGLRILAADDNPMNRLVLKTLLSEFGSELRLVSDGREAIAAWRAEPWDVVLMDIQMPVMDGVSAIQLMRKTERREGLARTPVIALTANAMAHHRADYLAAGMDAVVAKPVSLLLLLQAINEVMDDEVEEDVLPSGVTLEASRATA
jgi:PAS domain S-box-containing protein